MGGLQTVQAGGGHSPGAGQLLTSLIEAGRPGQAGGPCQPGRLQEASAALRGARAQEGGWPGPLKQQVEALRPGAGGGGLASAPGGSASAGKKEGCAAARKADMGKSAGRGAWNGW